MNCQICNNTGRKPGSQYNDCTAPGCTAAESRASLEDLCKLQPAHHTEEEICWWAFGRGQESLRGRITELEREVAANRQQIAQLERELSAERMVHGATKRLKEQLDAQLKAAPLPPSDICEGCNGHGMVGNIINSDVCPFCQGSGKTTADNGGGNGN